MKIKFFSKNKKSLKMLSEIVYTLKKYGVKRASIFGSYARGEQTKESDVDIMIEPTKGMGLFSFAGIKLELEDKLGRKVDLITYKALHPYIKSYVKKDEVKII